MSGNRGSSSRRQRVLLLDVGNSRLKWALLSEPYRRDRRFAVCGAFDIEQLAGRGVALRRLIARHAPLAGVEVCNVAGAAVERRLRAIVRSAGLAPPQFVRSARSAGGVRNGYPQPWRLGVDRWAALIGAHAQYPARALCLVAVGTAMTIDLIDAEGRHRGGNITPGPDLMVASLLQRTAGIRRRAGAHARSGGSLALRAPLFARNTRAAITGGALHAAAALIREAMRCARTMLPRRPQLILSGGAADDLAALIELPHRRRDDLALHGLAELRSARTRLA